MSQQRHNHGARSLPYKRAYVAAMVIGFIRYIAIIAAATLLYLVIRTGEPRLAQAFAGALGAIALSWCIGYIFRRSAKCPLCKGTPLLDTRASKHVKAERIKPLNYGATAQLKLTLTHRFRCMYCGTPFDLLRKPGKRMDGR